MFHHRHSNEKKCYIHKHISLEGWKNVPQQDLLQNVDVLENIFSSVERLDQKYTA